MQVMRAVGSCLGKFDLWALYKMSIGSSKLSNQYRILIADKEPFSAWASTCDSWSRRQKWRQPLTLIYEASCFWISCRLLYVHVIILSIVFVVSSKILFYINRNQLHLLVLLWYEVPKQNMQTLSFLWYLCTFFFCLTFLIVNFMGPSLFHSFRLIFPEIMGTIYQTIP